ncbi:class I SAM-dependent methyltransferase [Sphingobacterium rhinopitheci]|uniref:class I SAM-dependent methyltransferase n=1 Tax=Sphingobacterium rhinopitheci TaxID=2781960 RepID=UPI001F517FB7|nr:SAM-dependent methyltransferase [Sphingobacterium rhinopitheci]MCI0922249.1 SAM-dependent methyltransferase [Sphingobacterium rhinopitheci]
MTLPSFINKLKLAIENESFIKLSLGNYKGNEPNLKNIYAKLVLIKRELKISFTLRYQTRDITKNMPIEEGITYIIEQLQTDGFRAATLFNQTENIVLQYNNKGDWFIKTEKATASKPTSLTHDHQKERKVGSTSKQYLQELRLTDENGKVYKNAQDKWKQINHYIELLSTELKNLPKKEKLKVVDMGAGKGYLTFALHDYLSQELGYNVLTEGIEYRDDLVELCNQIAKKAAFKDFEFKQGTIEDYQPEADIDVLIALHACDTATDDAIYKGIKYNAELIVVAPCCHKQVRRELERVKASNELDFMTQYGIFLERHAEMLTDSIRALILEYFGYQTKVMQFISDAHTPKNVMIVGVKKSINLDKQKEIKNRLNEIKNYFGLDYHHLERISHL